MILDAGVLISVERNDVTAQLFVAATLRKGAPLRVSAQVWRGGRDHPILTGDASDLDKLVDPLPAGPAKPLVYAWP